MKFDRAAEFLDLAVQSVDLGLCILHRQSFRHARTFVTHECEPGIT